jgi:hypothetical protein
VLRGAASHRTLSEVRYSALRARRGTAVQWTGRLSVPTVAQRCAPHLFTAAHDGSPSVKHELFCYSRRRLWWCLDFRAPSVVMDASPFGTESRVCGLGGGSCAAGLAGSWTIFLRVRLCLMLRHQCACAPLPLTFFPPTPNFFLGRSGLSLKLTAVLDPTWGGCSEIWFGSFPSTTISAVVSSTSWSANVSSFLLRI